MANQNKLTAVKISKAKAGSVLSDGTGLILRKTQGGGKWVFRYSFAGKRRDMQIGALPDMSLADARKKRQHWASVLTSGLDPISERNRIRETEADALSKADPTFEEIARIVYDAKQDSLKNEQTRLRWWSPLKIHVLPKIGNRAISSITQQDIYQLLKPLWRTKHVTADKCLYRSRMVFQHARLMGYDADPFVCDAARHMLGHVHHEPEPIPATPWQEIPDLYARLDGPHPSHLALRWAILTAARSTPVRGARFDEIDGDVWTVPADRVKGLRGKVRDFRIPLSAAALDVLAVCEEYRRSDFMFPSPRRHGGVSDVAVAKILNKMGEPGRIHGFRTSFRSWVQDTEAGAWEVAETALAHTIGNRVERSYARSDLLEKRRILMEKWGQFVTGHESAAVIPLAR